MILIAVLGWEYRPASGQPSGPSEYEVESVYLFDFSKFVRWPAEVHSQALTICTAGSKAHADALAKIVAGEQVDSRPVEVRTVERPEEETGCNILFIGAGAKDRLEVLLNAASGKPSLTVSDVPHFLDRGGMIQFLLIDNRVRFSVDLGSVSRSGLLLSSELLKVAVNVTGKPVGGEAQ